MFILIFVMLFAIILVFDFKFILLDRTFKFLIFIACVMTVLMISVPITLFNYSCIFYSLHFVVELFTSFFLSILLNIFKKCLFFIN